MREPIPILALAHEERPALDLQERGPRRHVLAQVLREPRPHRPVQLLPGAARLPGAPQLVRERLGELHLLLVGEALRIARARLIQPPLQVGLVEIRRADLRAWVELVERRQHHPEEQRPVNKIPQVIGPRDPRERLVRGASLGADLPHQSLHLRVAERLDHEPLHARGRAERLGQRALDRGPEVRLAREIAVARRHDRLAAAARHREQRRHPPGEVRRVEPRGHLVEPIEAGQEQPPPHEQPQRGPARR